MSQCKKINKYLSSGKFDETLSQIPQRLTEHLDTCEECRQMFNELVAMETSMYSIEREKLALRAKARIRMGVLKSVTDAREVRFQWFRPRVSFMAASMLIIVLLAVISRNGDSPAKPPELALKNPEEIEMILDYMNDSQAYNSTDYDASAILQNDYELISVALDSWYSPLENVYEETILTSISSFDDSDWDALRRYMI